MLSHPNIQPVLPLGRVPLGDQVVYPNVRTDDHGQSLHGGNRYVLHFEPGQQPMASLWTLSLHTAQNGLEFSRLSSTPVYGEDGALTIMIQRDPPKEKGNWLAAPDEAFTINMRFYGPHRSILDGSWMTPSPVRLEWT